MTDQELYDAQTAAKELMAEAHEAERLRSRVAELEARLAALSLPADAPARTYEEGWRDGVAYACTQFPDDSRFRSQIVDDLMDASPPAPPSDSRDRGERPICTDPDCPLPIVHRGPCAPSPSADPEVNKS